MALLVTEMRRLFFEIIGNNYYGVTEEELMEEIHKRDLRYSVLFSYKFIKDLIETNIELGRIEKNNGRYCLSEKGRKYVQEFDKYELTVKEVS